MPLQLPCSSHSLLTFDNYNLAKAMTNWQIFFFYETHNDAQFTWRKQRQMKFQLHWLLQVCMRFFFVRFFLHRRFTSTLGLIRAWIIRGDHLDPIPRRNNEKPTNLFTTTKMANELNYKNNVRYLKKKMSQMHLFCKNWVKTLNRPRVQLIDSQISCYRCHLMGACDWLFLALLLSRRWSILQKLSDEMATTTQTIFNRRVGLS